jgi:hypothetical protein
MANKSHYAALKFVVLKAISFQKSHPHASYIYPEIDKQYKYSYSLTLPNFDTQPLPPPSRI